MEVPETVVTPLQQQYLKKHRQHHLFVAICRLLGFLLILTVWELSSDFQLIDSFIFSSPLKVVRTIGTMWTDGSLIRHTAITLGETAASFILVILFSFLTATLLWFFHSLSEILEPWLVILNSLPKSALAPLLIVWLGASMRTIIVAGMSVAIFGSIISMYTAFCEIRSGSHETNLYPGWQPAAGDDSCGLSLQPPLRDQYPESQYRTLPGRCHHR